MATIVEFTADIEQFPLGTIITEFSGVTVELERVVPEADGVVPYFWVRGIDVSDIVVQFSDHPGVRDITVVDAFETEYLMKCVWVPGYEGILSGLADSHAVLLEAIGTEAGWQFQIRGDDSESISDFREYCNDHGIQIHVTAINTLVQPDHDQPLTEAQQEALLLAYERGYFDSPRNATLSDIAAELDISQQALGGRIRRGTHRLISNAAIDST